jgi:hypothetical protein
MAATTWLGVWAMAQLASSLAAGLYVLAWYEEKRR